MAKIGIDQTDWTGWSFPKLKEFWVEIDAMGYDSSWVADNVVWYDNVTHDDMPIHEAWTTLAALATVTKNIRLGPMVTPCRRRHPALLAKTCATVDWISEGRLNVGLGTGDSESHFELWGIDLPPVRERIDILREEIEILKRLWTEDQVSFDGRYYRLREAPCNPRPIQKPHPPIWMGLILGRTLMPRLIAELADGVSVYVCSDHAAKQHLRNIERYCSEVGRDFSEIEKGRDLYVYLSEDGKNLPTKEPDFTESLEELGEMARSAHNRDLAYEHITRRYVIGTPGKVAEELLGILDMGFDHLTIIGLNSLEQLELFARTVMPVLKEH